MEPGCDPNHKRLTCVSSKPDTLEKRRSIGPLYWTRATVPSTATLSTAGWVSTDWQIDE